MKNTSLKGFLFSFLTTGLCLSYTACTTADKDLFNPDVVEQNVKEVYKSNFIKKYGPIDPAQTWDLSGGPSYTLSLEKTRSAVTRSTPSYTVSSGTADTDYMEIPTSLTQWMKNELKEGQDNSAKGHAFYMTMPNADAIYITPIYQGNASMTWDFCIGVGEGDATQKIDFWKKNDNLQICDVSRTDGKEAEFPTWTNLGQHNATTNKNAAHTMNNEYAIRGKEYKISGIESGTPIHFFLKINNGDPNYALKDTEQSSLIGQLLEMNCPDNIIADLNLPDGYKAKIIGCEDANLAGGDWDYNDVVFLLRSNPLPDVVEIKTDVVTETTGKRYMVEDLGATDDFDFNDIVFDVVRTSKVSFINGEQVKEQIEQKVDIRAAGGMLDFIIKIGSFGWKKSQAGYKAEEMINTTSPDWDKLLNYSGQHVPGWNADANNVSVEVLGSATVTGTSADRTQSTTVTFPKAGEVPMIIAVPLNTRWMKERQSIPKSWFTEVTSNE